MKRQKASGAVSRAAALIGRRGGKAKTDAKAKAVRANGAKGGRPPKRRRMLKNVGQQPPRGKEARTRGKRPWSTVVLRGTLVEKTSVTKTGIEIPNLPSRQALEHLFGLPVAAFYSSAGDPPYVTWGGGEAGGVTPAEYQEVRDALRDVRQIVADLTPREVRDAKTLKIWAAAKLSNLRRLVDEGERFLAAGRYPGDIADEIASAADAYADALFNLGLDDDRPFDDTGVTYASPSED